MFQLIRGPSLHHHSRFPGKCDYFVSTDGADSNDGTDLDSPFATLKCACDPDCNKELQQGETICLLAGVHEVYDTIYVKGPHMREQKLAIMALGKDRSVTLDGMGLTSIFNALQTRVTFTGQCAPTMSAQRMHPPTSNRLANPSVTDREDRCSTITKFDASIFLCAVCLSSTSTSRHHLRQR